MANHKHLGGGPARKPVSYIQKYAPYGRCECGYPLQFESGWHGTFDEPASQRGYYCAVCDVFEPVPEREE